MTGDLIHPEDGFAHYACPSCGHVATWPSDRQSEKLMCPHTGSVTWGVEADHWSRMVPVRVTQA